MDLLTKLRREIQEVTIWTTTDDFIKSILSSPDTLVTRVKNKIGTIINQSEPRVVILRRTLQIISRLRES